MERRYDASLVVVGEFGVHSRRASVAVGEGVDFGDRKHDERGAPERRAQALQQGEASPERAFHEIGDDKIRRSRRVGESFERAGPHVRTSRHDRRRPRPETILESGEVPRDPGDFAVIGNKAPCAERAGGVLRTLFGNDASKRDIGGFLRGELDTFNEVGEMGFEKGERRIGRGCGNGG